MQCSHIPHDVEQRHAPLDPLNSLQVAISSAWPLRMMSFHSHTQTCRPPLHLYPSCLTIFRAHTDPAFATAQAAALATWDGLTQTGRFLMLTDMHQAWRRVRRRRPRRWRCRTTTMMRTIQNASVTCDSRLSLLILIRCTGLAAFLSARAAALAIRDDSNSATCTQWPHHSR